MSRGTFWLLGPVVVAAAVVFVYRGGEVDRADHFFFQVMGLALVFWALIAVARAISDRKPPSS